ncbi:MAG: WGxxGxxG family protein [Mycobacterium sp.]
MRKAIAVSSTTLALLFGGAGVAHATATPDVHSAPAATSTLAADETNDDSGDNGLWGLVGLLGLLGLLGLRRRNDAHHGVGTTQAPGGSTTPRA